MRIFTRYILREITGYLLLSGVLFTFILFMRYLLPLMELAVRGAASPADILRLVGYLLPSFFTLTVPMAVLAGILLGLSRLAADSEITAMRASGMGVVDFVRVVSVIAVLCWALGLVNSLYVAPRAAAALLAFEDQSKSGQAAVEVQPRVFYEDFKNYVLYAQDVVPGTGAAVWRNVLLADLTQPATPHIITAQQAIVQSGGSQTLRLRLVEGSRHDISPKDPQQYDISTFASTELPIQAGQGEDSHITRHDTPMQALSTGELWRRSHHAADRRPYTVEWNRRLSFPAACLVLMLVGVPLGLSSKRGGKATGFVVTLVLVLLYYVMWGIGIALAREGKVSAILGVWSANLIFAAAGIFLIQQLSRNGLALSMLSDAGLALAKLASRPRKVELSGLSHGSVPAVQRLRRVLRSRFPLILDEYVMSGFLRNFVLVLASLSALFLIFTFFELIGDIIRNRTPLVTVGDYLFNLVPFVLYNVVPVCSLLAVLITFGTLSRTSEITAMKATGVSLYRMIAPVLLVAALLSTLLFAFDEYYLPGANRRQQALRSAIKGKPAQTFLRPDRQWMSGQASRAGEPSRIFYYQFFDGEKNVFANLTVFEFEPGSFSMTRRIFASSAHWDDRVQRWVLEDGWQRGFEGETVSNFQPFTIASFPEIHEQPAYFKKEARPSQEMSYGELSAYIRDLKQSGFDTMRLRVQLNRKLADPLVTLVMAVLAVPFALSAGKRGGLAGIGAGVGVAIAYFVVSAVFENLGDVNSLPAGIAAWSPDVLFAAVGGYLLLRTQT